MVVTIAWNLLSLDAPYWRFVHRSPAHAARGKHGPYYIGLRGKPRVAG